MVTLQELFEELNKRIDKPLDYNHILTSFLSSATTGAIVFIDGLGYYFDPVRGKYLAVSRTILSAGQFGQNQNSRYMRMSDVPMQAAQGFLLPRDATITGLWAKSRSTSAWSVEVRKNGAPITLVAVPISGGSGSDLTLNYDLNAGDVLQIFQSGSAIDHPIAGIEFAWRTTT